MKIQLINPNTTVAMTEKMAVAARQVASGGTQILAAQSATGPASIESAMDEALALPGLLAQIQAGEAAGVDAHVDRKSTRLNSSHIQKSRMPSSA